jgi:hypothetical protein
MGRGIDRAYSGGAEIRFARPGARGDVREEHGRRSEYLEHLEGKALRAVSRTAQCVPASSSVAGAPVHLHIDGEHLHRFGDAGRVL